MEENAVSLQDSTTNDQEIIIIDKNEFYRHLEKYYSSKPNKKPYSKEKIESVIREISVAKSKKKSKSRREYHLLHTYDVLVLDSKSHLIKKTNKNEIIYVPCYEELFDKIYECHVNKTKHGGRLKMEKYFGTKLAIPRPALLIFLSCCRICNEKKKVGPTSNKVVRPTLSKSFCEKGQMDVIDFQYRPDGNYKWILSYQDHSTKFVVLRPLCSKCPQEVASVIIKIFLLVGAPKILLSNNEKEFVNKIIAYLRKMWPECMIVHDRPRQGSIERSDQDVENMLRTWMLDTGCNQWSVGLDFVQWQKNSSHHRKIDRSPYKALFGFEPKLGLASSKSPFLLAEKIKIEEQLEIIFQETDAGAESMEDVDNNYSTSRNGNEANRDVREFTDTVGNNSNENETGLSDDSIIGNTITCCVCFCVMVNRESQCELCRKDIHYSCVLPSHHADKILCLLCRKSNLH